MMSTKFKANDIVRMVYEKKTKATIISLEDARKYYTVKGHPPDYIESISRYFHAASSPERDHVFIRYGNGSVGYITVDQIELTAKPRLPNFL